MARPRSRSTRRFDPSSLMLPVAAVALAALGAVLLLRGGTTDDGAGAGLPEGMVGVPVAAVDLPAYTEIRLEHLFDPRTGDLAVVPLAEESILDSTFVEPVELIGRVLARPKSARRVFREEDFLPVGTRPGLVAGIPPGKRALRIDASKVSGIVGLQQGDRFDLVATFRGGDAGGPIESVYGARGMAPSASSARSRTIAEDAAVVTALESRALPGAAASRSGAVVQEMVIALEPDEVPIVTESLEGAARIDCIPRSGLPGASERTADQRSARPGAWARGRGEAPIVDVIEGDQRSLRRVPEGLVDVPRPPVAARPPSRERAGGDG